MSVSYLKLVRDRSGQPDFAQPKFEQVQQSLIPARERTVAICTADGLTENVIRSLIETLKPRIIVDLRTAPRFDFGTLNRGKALDLFTAIGAIYFDADDARPQDSADPDGLGTVIAKYATQLVNEAPTSAALVLLDAGVDFQRTGVLAIQKLRAVTKLTWEVLLIGPPTQDQSQRNVLFISHANPEDNEIALWLQTQLTRMGYETWTDTTSLKAGEVFWDTIEDTIRTKAARVIALISHHSLRKPGVLDEISLAISTERTRNLSGFVIPIRVDDVPHSEFRANLSRKNVVDFSRSWASGLSLLSEALAKDRIPRQRQAEGHSLAKWWEERKAPVLSVVHTSENLISNKFQLVSAPSRVYLFAGEPEYPLGKCAPLTPYRGHWVSFVSARELEVQGIRGLSLESVMSADDLFAGNLEFTAHAPASARSRLRTAMLNRQWLAYLTVRGLKLYSQAGFQPTPYVPDGLVPNNTASFSDFEGKQRKRLLVGYSEKRNLHWHLAPVGSFSGGRSPALALKLRVLFSVDGQSDWPSVEKMTATRTAFCKNWWNDRWLSLQYAFINWLSEGKAEIHLHSGDGGSLALSSIAKSYVSPVSICEAHTKTDLETVVSAPALGDDDWTDDVDPDEGPYHWEAPAE